MYFSIHKQNHSYSFIVSYHKAVLIAGTAGSREEALSIIFNQIKEILG